MNSAAERELLQPDALTPKQHLDHLGWLASQAASLAEAHPDSEEIALQAMIATIKYDAAYHTDLLHRDLDTRRQNESICNKPAQMEAMWQAAEHAARLEQEKLVADMEMEMKIRRLEHASTHDSMTGTYNRAGFLKVAASVLSNLRPNQAAKVYLADVDGLKKTNDDLGHEAGDRLIRVAVNALDTKCGPNLTARWGGDEAVSLHIIELDTLESRSPEERFEEIRRDSTFKVKSEIKEDELLRDIKGAGISIGQSHQIILGSELPDTKTGLLDLLEKMIGEADRDMYSYKPLTHRSYTRQR